MVKNQGYYPGKRNDKPFFSLSFKYIPNEVVVRCDLMVFLATMRLPFGVWSCHDLSSLKMAWLASRFRAKKPYLVYDSHEYELGRNIRRSAFQRWRVAQWEGFLMRRCIFSIMVNETIADQVMRVHHLASRPVVVRSTPECWKIDETVWEQTREKLWNSMGMHKNELDKKATE